MLYGGRVPQKGGLTGAQEQVLYRDGVIPVAEAAEETLAVGDAAAEASAEQAAEGEGLQGLGHKWPLPSRPYPDGFNHKKRYHPVIEQVSRLMMRDGKLATAQRVRGKMFQVFFRLSTRGVEMLTGPVLQNLAMAMNILRMSPEPTYNPQVPLMPGVPPASHLPLNPTMYLTVAMDSVAPLIKIVAIAGAGGGGRSLDMPRPLTVRQRRRRAFMWILEAAEKRQSKGSGRTQFPQRLAEEIIAVVEGRSGAWDKRKLIHKQGTAARANVTKRLHIKKGPSK